MNAYVENGSNTKWRTNLAGKRTKKDARNGQSKASENSYEQAPNNQPKRQLYIDKPPQAQICDFVTPDVGICNPLLLGVEGFQAVYPNAIGIEDGQNWPAPSQIMDPNLDLDLSANFGLTAPFYGHPPFSMPDMSQIYSYQNAALMAEKMNAANESQLLAHMKPNFPLPSTATSNRTVPSKPTDKSKTSKTQRHDQEQFQIDFVAAATALWTTRDSVTGAASTVFPNNSDDVTYRVDQLEQIAARIHKDLRRMHQRTPGKSRDKFISIIQRAIEIQKKMAQIEPLGNFQLESDRIKRTKLQLEIEKLKKSLENTRCVHSLSSKTQDNRIQIEKWDILGKAKKVYLYWELYNIFNRIDPHRDQMTRIRHSNLFRSYCKTEESSESTLLCLNPLHYQVVMEVNIFAEQECEKD